MIMAIMQLAIDLKVIYADSIALAGKNENGIYFKIKTK